MLALLALLSVTYGSFAIPIDATVGILWSELTGDLPVIAWPSSWQAVLIDVRVPRVVLAALAGAALAPSGAVFQGLFRNPLGDPYLLGISSGAGLGATLALAFGITLPWAGGTGVAILAFAGALLATGTVYALARTGGRVSIASLLLAGVALSAFLTSITTFLMFQADDAFHSLHVLSWLMGSFSLANWTKVRTLVPVLLVGGTVMWALSHRLNVLQLDDDQAHQLGVPVERTKAWLLVASSLVTATAVSVSGTIGFVGLIVPHAVRLIWGPDHRFLIPMSALVGAAFMLLADGVARTVLSPAEIPVGVVTAFCGAPFFLYLVQQRGRFLAS